MKVDATRIRQRQVLLLPVSVKKRELEQEVEHKENPSILNGDISTNLKEQILTVQKTKTLFGVESFAAAEFPVKKYTALAGVAELDWKFWRESNSLHCYQVELEVIIIQMKKLLEGQSIDASYLVECYPDYMNNITDSLLVQVVRGDRIVRKLGGAWYDPPSNFAQKTAAQALRIMIQKVGDLFSKVLSSQKEAELIKLLLGSPTRDVRLEGALAAENTYRHKWRRNLGSTGLILALEKEKDNSVRSSVARAIAYANPEAILKEHSVGVRGERFCPIARYRADLSIDVKINLAYGVAVALAALIEQGRYFDDFQEVPEISAAERLRAFDCSIKSLEELVYADNLTEDEKKLLLNTTCIIYNLVNNEAHADSNRISSPEQNKEFDRLLNRLSQIDIIKFIEKVTHTQFSDPSWKGNSVWGSSRVILATILAKKNDSGEKVLNYYFSLRKKVIEMMSHKDGFVLSNLRGVLDVIDNSIGRYLSGIDVDEIKWGDYTEFNSTVNDLLNFVERAQSDSHKLAVLNLFGALNEKGVSLSNHGNVDLESALDSSNKPRLKQTLHSMVYSKPVTKELFLSPPATTLQGKALHVYREMTPSFKDYFGMIDLKERALEVAVDCVNGNRFSKGLLFSGAPGTGKSRFGEVLANELALPLELLSDGMVTETNERHLLIVESKEKRYTSEQYIEKLSRHGICVVLVDEINKMASPNNERRALRFLALFQKLQQANIHSILIATTNFPILDNVNEFSIDENGHSEELDKLVREFVHPAVFDFFEPCHLFQQKSVGYGFTRGYLEYLAKRRVIIGDVNLEAAGRLARGLRPLRIINTISEIPERPFPAQAIESELRRLKLDTSEIKQLQNLMLAMINILKLPVEGKLNLSELALEAEDMPTESIAKILGSAPTPLTQASLLELFRNHSR